MWVNRIFRIPRKKLKKAPRGNYRRVQFYLCLVFLIHYRDNKGRIINYMFGKLFVVVVASINSIEVKVPLDKEEGTK